MTDRWLGSTQKTYPIGLGHIHDDYMLKSPEKNLYE